MPTIRNRRSRARREPSSDRIEEGPTQDEAQEDVDENGDASEEEQPRRRGSAQQKPAKKAKKEKTSRTSRTQEEEGNEEGGDGAQAAPVPNNDEEEVDELLDGVDEMVDEDEDAPARKRKYIPS